MNCDGFSVLIRRGDIGSRDVLLTGGTAETRHLSERSVAERPNGL